METETYIRELVSRLTRLDAASSWNDDLNPSQTAVLNYLAKANRFSRSPSHVAAYLGTTRGTISQSLKSLNKKGYVNERRSTQDKRVISYDLTAKGREVASSTSQLECSIASLDENEKESLQDALAKIMRLALSQNGNQEFGICRTCIHHKPKADGAYCSLLSEHLTVAEADQICAEQVGA